MATINRLGSSSTIGEIYGLVTFPLMHNLTLLYFTFLYAWFYMNAVRSQEMLSQGLFIKFHLGLKSPKSLHFSARMPRPQSNLSTRITF